jgi:glycosyltransferase involved in cell wall biosynthesis
MIEAMACGTPVVAYAKGSVPEVIADGVTGFIVNSGESDKRGDWIIKKTGIEGLSEAVERIYSMSGEDYKKMRFACRKYVEKNFSVEKMIEEYEKIYRKLLNK